MTFKTFFLKLFGYTQYPNGKIMKIHKPIFGLVFMNLIIMPLEWLKAKRLGIESYLLPKKSAVEFAVNNPMNAKAKIGYIEALEYKKENENEKVDYV